MQATDPPSGPTAALARWAAALRHEDIPEPVLAHARREVLDTLAVGWAGTVASGADVVARIAAARPAGGAVRLWGGKGRATPADAALLNGIAAAALDWDGVHDTAGVHASAVLLPALLASAEARGASGRELLTAYVAGAEAMARLGSAMTTQPGWFYSSVVGVIAAAIACGRLAGLDGDGVRAAMGVALSRAAGSQQALVERSLTKRMQSAFAARDGLECAFMAGCGVSAPREALEGTFGLATLYAPMDLESVVRGLGVDWAMRRTAFKAWPSCLCNHAAISATLELAEREDLAADDVESVTVEITPFMNRLVGAPFEPGDDPQVAAQFSARYSVACVLLRRRLSVADLEPAAVLDPAIDALVRRIDLRVVESETGRFAPATVTVTRRDGRRASRTATDFPGARGRELDGAALVAKARECFAAGVRPLSPDEIDALVARLLAVDAIEDVRALLSD
ncbi:MAG TPA: MmgE/PrpD family protein [Burkholderiaceae bacterium]|nr:MmgE/PrpD family protein [Burkholderiaceae bacterium]